MTILNGYEGFKFGADPEFFVFKGDKPVPAVGLLPGTKDAPERVKGGAIQVDGLAGEINIDPVTNFKDFNQNIDDVVAEVWRILKSHGDDYSVKWTASVVFDAEDYDPLPDLNKQLGCDPDYDAWTGLQNEPPSPENKYLRCAGGHLHVGWDEDLDVTDEDHLKNCRDLCKQLDWYLGAWSLSLDSDKRRRSLYGKAGAFRPKPYGCEYRTLSNFWLQNNNRRLTVWNRMQRAITDIAKSHMPEKYANYNDMVVTAINTSTRDRVLENTFYSPIREIVL